MTTNSQKAGKDKDKYDIEHSEECRTMEGGRKRAVTNTFLCHV
jgi:hypothetical protein